MSRHPPKAVIVIPCYNEATRLAREEFSLFLSENPGVHLLFVDDGSDDDTYRVLKSFEPAHANAAALSCSRNVGKAEAVRFGLHHALRNSQAPYVGYFDADLSTPLGAVHGFLAKLDTDPSGLRMVFGSRMKRLGAEIKRNAGRHIVGRLFATLASSLLLAPVYNTQCGAKVFDRGIAAGIFGQPFMSRWLFDVELIARAIIELGYQDAMDAICEYPLDHWADDGNSRIRLRDVLRVPYELWRIHLAYHDTIKRLKEGVAAGIR